MGKKAEKTMHPAMQERKEARKRELKKVRSCTACRMREHSAYTVPVQMKKQRQDFRAVITTVKDPRRGYEELQQLNDEGEALNIRTAIRIV